MDSLLWIIVGAWACGVVLAFLKQWTWEGFTGEKRTKRILLWPWYLGKWMLGQKL